MVPEAAPSTSPAAPALTYLQSQLHKTQTSLASHVDKIRALEGVISERDTIKREVELLRQLVEKTTNNGANREEEEFGAGDDDASIRTIVLHELERVREEDEDQIEKQEQQLEGEDEEGGAW
jgi:hypothetical protein